MTLKEAGETNKDYFKKRDLLNQSMKSGEILKIQYNGGSNPGDVREIAPIEFEWDHKVLALCLKSNQEKTFSIDKMIFLSDKQYELKQKMNGLKGQEGENEHNGCITWIIIIIVIIISIFAYKCTSFFMSDDSEPTKKDSITNTYDP